MPDEILKVPIQSSAKGTATVKEFTGAVKQSEKNLKDAGRTEGK